VEHYWVAKKAALWGRVPGGVILSCIGWGDRMEWGAGPRKF